MSDALLTTDPVKLAALVQEGAEAVQASMTRIADLETQNQKQAGELAGLRNQITDLETQLSQAKQATSSAALTITQEQALKYASILVEHEILDPQDKQAAATKMVEDPTKLLGVMDKLAAMLPAPAARRDGSLLKRSFTDKFAEGSNLKKETWY